MGRTIGVIRARMGSDRLPGGIIAPLAGRPLLALLRTRIAAARVDEWWLATSRRPMDDVNEAWGFELGLRVHRGADASRAAAVRAIADETGAAWLVVMRASHPFVDAGMIDTLLDARDGRRESKEADVIRIGAAATRTPHRHGSTQASADLDVDDPDPALPRGYTVEAIRRATLERDGGLASNDVNGCAAGAAADLDVHDCPAPPDWPSRPGWRWSIESYEDLAMARSAFRVFGREAETIDYPAMVAALDAHPEIAGMNRNGGVQGGPSDAPTAHEEASTRWGR